MRRFHVYILASRSRNLYIGVTNNLHRRLQMHRTGEVLSTAKYRIVRLVYVESTDDVRAIAREKQLKGWRRDRKISLISSMNPAWDDLLPDGGPSPDVQVTHPCAQDDSRCRSFPSLRSGQALRSG